MSRDDPRRSVSRNSQTNTTTTTEKKNPHSPVLKMSPRVEWRGRDTRSGVQVMKAMFSAIGCLSSGWSTWRSRWSTTGPNWEGLRVSEPVQKLASANALVAVSGRGRTCGSAAAVRWRFKYILACEVRGV